MKNNPIKKTILFGIVFFLLAFWFRNSFFTFFSQDDFFRFKMSSANSFSEVVGFFSFQNRHQYGFYRPISINLYSFLGLKLFGLNHYFYHIFNFLVFSGTVLLVFKIAKIFFKDTKNALFASIFYGFSASHLTTLSYLPNVEEIIVAFFYFLTIYLYLQKNRLALLSFVLALLSRETAVTLPLILVALEWSKTRKWRKTIPFFLILLSYFSFRYLSHLLPDQSVYQTTFVPSKLLNNFFWFFLWAIGFPEELVDFVGPGIKINPKFFNIYSPLPILIVILGTIFAVWLAWQLFFKFFKEKKSRPGLILFGLWFVITLLPFLSLKSHKFASYLEIPLFGLACIMSMVLVSNRTKAIIGTTFFLLLSFLTVSFYNKTYWGINRPKMSERILNQLKAKYPSFPKGALIYFLNDKNYQSPSLQWGQTSTQAKLALSACHGPQIFYRDPTLKCLFEDDGEKMEMIKEYYPFEVIIE